MKIIGEAGVPAGAVFDTLELLNDPSLAERGIMQTIEHPTTGKLKVPAWPVRFDGSPAQGQAVAAAGPAQRRGARAWLGISAPRSRPCAPKALSDPRPVIAERRAPHVVAIRASRGPGPASTMLTLPRQ